MSESVVPTKPGLWYYRHIESHGMPDSVVLVREVTAEDDDHGTFTGELVAEFSESDELLEVGNVNGTWLRPIPSAEAVQEAVESLKECRDELITLRSRLLRGVIERADNAIAGLTGGEG